MCVSVLVIERYYQIGKLCAFLFVVKRVISLYGLLWHDVISFKDCLLDTCRSLCDFSESCTWIFFRFYVKTRKENNTYLIHQFIIRNV